MIRDFTCPLCGEPWEFPALENEARDSNRPIMVVWDAFEQSGCIALGVPHLVPGV